ncbi:MAG: hypothetical protein U5K51_06740 [Flavobacteriaceae bacterium]|nr:hypothetical protein [Flavobacteriaceae bacterium]
MVLIGLIFSCSTKKDSYLNRTGNSVSTKFNVLYNGNVAFDEAKKQLDATYEDNYWETLPIEPIKIEDNIPLPGQSQAESPIKQGFEKSEEKSVKAIQKHSMVIDGYERNDQIDDAYLLLGKSRYFSQRFVPALDAFTFALEKYPNADLYLETKIWKAKTDIRLQNETLAIETLNSIVRSEAISEELLEKAHTALAMAYVQLDSTQLAIDNLKYATYYFKDKEQGSRNMFILGQMYREENKLDSSNMMFEALTYLKKVPRKYMVHAQIERAKNYSDKDSTDAMIFALRKLGEDRENKPYFDELYYQAGLIAQKKGDTGQADDFFQKSLRENTAKPFQKSLSYEALGNLNFDQSKYLLAGAYYDSVLQIKSVDPNSKRIRRIAAKNKSLEEVIYYEQVLKTNDSILYLVSLPEAERQAYFNSYVAELKKQDELNRTIAEQQSNFGNEFLSDGSKQSAGESFYFYNPQTLGFGKQEFKNRFGNRTLTDNWIFSRIAAGNQEMAMQTNPEVTDLKQRYDPAYYLQFIPSEPKQIDSIADLRNNAHYNLGLLYKEQFKEYSIAAGHFEKYLANDPAENLILPVKYQLFRCYENFDPAKGNISADDIVNNYPDSRYAQIIKNPEKVIKEEDNESSPENIYKNAFICYEEGEYNYALSLIKNSENSYREIPIEAKFELLKALIASKTIGPEAYKMQLDYVMANYPNTAESDFAKMALENLKNQKK